MKSDRKPHTDPSLTKTGDDGTGSDSHNRRGGPFGYPERHGSAATSSDIPLVHVGFNAKPSSETMTAGGHVNATFPWPTGKGNDRSISGFEAV